MKRYYTGTVLWFDALTGQGAIREHESQRQVSVYACNITGSKSLWLQLACVSLKAGQVVEFNYHPDCGAVDVSGGIFDAEKWERVKTLNASFTVREDGSMSGLFAEKKRGE